MIPSGRICLCAAVLLAAGSVQVRSQTQPNSLPSAIDALTRQIDARRGLTEATIEPLPNLSTVTDDAAAARRNYDAMRERLYMGDPKPGSAAAEAFAAFDTQWNALAPRIWTGARTTAPVKEAEWEALVRRVRGGNCPLGITIPDRVNNRTLSGPEWACVSDTYFQDLVDYEVKTLEQTASARREALAPLGAAIDDLDSWLAQTAGTRRLAPTSEQLRRQGAWRLHRVWLTGSIARRNELVRLQGRSPDSPFQKFLRHAPAIEAAPNSGFVSIRVPVGQKVTVRVAAASKEAQVVETPGASLANELYEVHRRLRLVVSRLAAADEQALKQWADSLEPDVAAQRHQLEVSRPTRAAAKRSEIEPQRKAILDRIAGR